MKRIIILLMLLGLLRANPVVIPQVTISELYFPDPHTWLLELDIMGDIPYQPGMFDSVFIASNAGRSKISPKAFKPDELIFVINADSLLSPLTIDPEGDCIKVITYESTDPSVDSLCIGHCSNTYFTTIPPGYSICRLGYGMFVKDKTPTIGTANDTCGTCATLEGYIYDIENELIPRGNFHLDSDLYFDDQGAFSTRVYSLGYGKTYLREFLEPGKYKNYKIDTLKINLEPDSVYQQNILILSDYIVGIENHPHQPVEELMIVNYPNPFNSTTTFQVQPASGNASRTKQIHIYGITGQLIKILNLDEHHRATWDGTNQQGILQASGIYWYRLVIDDVFHKSGSVVLLK